MINKIKSVITTNFVILILALAAVLRLWNLNNIPPHLTPDEAALGYNAYSILKTGRDEQGQFLPLVFKSFGDYKPGLYIYATVPFVAVFGLNEWSVRLPSALAGIGIVYLIYLISKKLFTVHGSLFTLVALVAATNPWLIYFSRGAWEANLSLMLTLLGIYFFLRSLHTTYYILYSTVAFAATLLTYQGAKLSTAIVVALLIIVYWKDFWNISKKYLLSSFALGIIICMPIILGILQGEGGRLKIFSVFSYPRPVEYIQKMLNQNGEKIGGINYYVFHNEPYNFLRGIMGRWFNHFSGSFLFFEGDTANPRHSAPYQGMFLLSDIIILLYGLVVLLKSHAEGGYSISNLKSAKFILLWLVLSPLPAILSRDQVHAVRSLNMAIPLILIAGIGLVEVLKQLRIVNYVFFAFYFLVFIYFYDSYFIHLPKQNSKLWEYGYKQIVEVVKPIKNNYQKIIIQQSFAQPYIYFLFFEKYDPVRWQAQNNYVGSEFKGDVGYVTDIDNIFFEGIDWSRDRGKSGTLFVADPIRIPPHDSREGDEFTIVKEIKYLNGMDIAFRIIEIK